MKIKKYYTDKPNKVYTFMSDGKRNSCGCIHKELKLKDRIYECKECGYVEDRDLNASFNIRDCLVYKIAN